MIEYRLQVLIVAIGALFFTFTHGAAQSTQPSTLLSAEETVRTQAEINAQSEIGTTQIAEPSITPKQKFPGIKAFIDGSVATLLEVHDIPGITVSVVHDGSILYSSGYGFADVSRTHPVDPDMTLFRNGSISKAFTWTAVMQLAEQGKLDLDRDVNDYIDQFQIPDAFDTPITLRHILSHAAGFEDGAVGFLFHREEEKLIPLADALKEYMPERVRAPGTFSVYSNWATALAGLIVANRSGQDFDSYIEENIFTPLGMTRSTFREPVPESLKGAQSENFFRESGDYVDGGFEYIHNFGPAGGMSTTSTDMAKFMIAHLGDGAYQGGQILPPNTVQQMREPILRHHPEADAMLHGFYEKTINGLFTYGHGGDTVHFHSEMTLFPEEKFGVFISTNSLAGGQAARQLIPALFDKYFPAKDDPHPAPANPETPDTDSMQALTKYAGAYRGNRRSYSRWEKIIALLSGDMTVTPSPRGGLLLTSVAQSNRFVEQSEHVFRSVDDPDERIIFRMGDDDKASHLFLGHVPIFAGDRVGTLQKSSTHQILWGISIITMIGVILGSIWGIPKWLNMSGGAKVARMLIFFASVLNLAFIFSIVVAVASDVNELVFSGIAGLGLLLYLPLLAAILSIGAALMIVAAWRNGYWSVFGRFRYMVVVLILLAFSVSMNYWNLLGPWYL